MAFRVICKSDAYKDRGRMSPMRETTKVAEAYAFARHFLDTHRAPNDVGPAGVVWIEQTSSRYGSHTIAKWQMVGTANVDGQLRAVWALTDGTETPPKRGR